MTEEERSDGDTVIYVADGPLDLSSTQKTSSGPLNALSNVVNKPSTPPPVPVVPPNPLIQLRYSLHLTIRGMAKHLGCSPTLVQYAEAGCYTSVPVPYRKHLHETEYHAYQRHRRCKRQANFSVEEFPDPPGDIHNVLRHLNLKLFSFATQMCVQPAEIFWLLGKERKHLPRNLTEAFLQVGLSPEWLGKLAEATLETKRREAQQ